MTLSGLLLHRYIQYSSRRRHKNRPAVRVPPPSPGVMSPLTLALPPPPIVRETHRLSWLVLWLGLARRAPAQQVAWRLGTQTRLPVNSTRAPPPSGKDIDSKRRRRGQELYHSGIAIPPLPRDPNLMKRGGSTGGCRQVSTSSP